LLKIIPGLQPNALPLSYCGKIASRYGGEPLIYEFWFAMSSAGSRLLFTGLSLIRVKEEKKFNYRFTRIRTEKEGYFFGVGASVGRLTFFVIIDFSED
jgi:hypothetical protein